MYTMESQEVEVGGRTYMCQGQVEFSYQCGDAGSPTSEPYSSYAEDINVILDEASDDEDKDVKCPKLMEDIRKGLHAHFDANQSVLTEYWEKCAEEEAAQNRFDEWQEHREAWL